MKKIFFATSALTFALLSGPAFAADNSADLARQIQALQDQLRSMQQQLDAVKASDAAQHEAIAKETAAREAAEKAAREANLEAGGHNSIENGTVKLIPPANPKVVETATHSFVLSSSDGNWTIQPTGRIHLDMGYYLNQKPEGTTGPGTVAGGRLTSGVNARRLRFGVTGRAMGDFTYDLILEAGGTNDGAPTLGSQLINSAKIGYTGLRNTVLEAGYGAQYFALEEATSSNNTMFIERSTPTILASNFNSGDPRFGAGFRTWEANWWLGAYLTSSVPGAVKNLTNRGFGAYERATYQIMQNDLESLHIGVAAAEVFDIPDTGPGTAKSFTMSDRPELRIDGTNILNTGALGTVANPVTGVVAYNVESAAAFGQLFYEGEYFHYVVDRRGKTSAQFDAAYVEASYAIGGRRTYSANCGCYGGINPIENFSPRFGGMGAVEFAARVSYANLVDQFVSSIPTAVAQPNGVNGGRQINYTAGLNWFWNPNMLWKFNYIHSHFDKATATTSGTPLGAGLDIDALAARFQIMF